MKKALRIYLVTLGAFIVWLATVYPWHAGWTGKIGGVGFVLMLVGFWIGGDKQ